MATKKSKATNPLDEILTMYERDPTKAGVMMGYELGRRLGIDIRRIIALLEQIEENTVLRLHKNSYEQAKKDETEACPDPAFPGRGDSDGPGSHPVPNGGAEDHRI